MAEIWLNSDKFLVGLPYKIYIETLLYLNLKINVSILNLLN